MLFAPTTRMATRRGHRPPHCCGLCTDAQGFVGHVFSSSQKIVLVQDNLSAHKPASLYQAFPARRGAPAGRAVRVAFYAQAGSWLNMAEIELSVLSSQCLDR